MLRKLQYFRITNLFSTAKQWLEPYQQINKKTIQLSKLIKQSKHPIFFTGAGCSTSIGIPDYRSGTETVVQTGPGIWNREQTDLPPKLRIDKIVDEAIPSYTHMAIKTLLDKNIFKFLVSQNTDGLHLRSGVKSNKIAQLHGNRNLEKCVSCKKQYLRDFRTIKRDATPEQKKLHLTGRKCQNCNGNLIDSIIYFGQKLPQSALAASLQQATACDLLLCIGSSLTVKPSSNVPIQALKKGAKVCIINIQQTPFDEVSDIKINGFCDQVMGKLMKQIGVQVQSFFLEYYLKLEIRDERVWVIGVDGVGNNYSCVRSVGVEGKEFGSVGNLVQIPYTVQMHQIQLHFYGNKPSLNIHLPSYYKLFHGQSILLKITKKHGDSSWALQQI